MADHGDREHYIPLRKTDLVNMLCKDSALKPGDAERFRRFCRIVEATWHFEYHEQLEAMKDAYDPFDPDRETSPLVNLTDDERPAKLDELARTFGELLEKANFERLSREEIQRFIDEVPTDWGLNVHVDLDQFERLEIYARGDEMGTRTRRLWWKFWKQESIQLPTFSRLVGLLKFRKGAKVAKELNTDLVFLKVFKDVAKADLDMLLPGARPCLSKFDQGMIALPMLSGVAMMLYSIIKDILDKDTPASAFLGLSGALLTWSAAAAVGGYGYKSYYSWQVKKQNYSFQLTRSLYFQTLDSNLGVLNRLLDEAEEQECRETFLAYFFLHWHAPAEGWTEEMLDDYVEMYLEGKFQLKVDFEVADALAKLEKLRVVTRTGDRYLALPLEEALQRVDERWDSYFDYNDA